MDTVKAGIVARDVKRGTRDVGRRDVSVRDLASQADRQATASSANVDKPGPWQLQRRENGHRFLDNELRLGTGNEHVRRDTKVESPEFTIADDVRRWLAMSAATKPLREARFERRRCRLAAGDQRARSVPAED